MNIIKRRRRAKRVVAWPLGGLMNRIKCILSAMRIAESNGCALEVYWVPDDDCGAELSALLSNDLIELREDPSSLFERKSCFIYRSWRLWVTTDDAVVKTEQPIYPFSNRYNDPMVYHLKYGRSRGSIDCEYHRIPDSVKEVYRKLLSSLELAADVSSRVEGHKELVDSTTIGVHVRRTDFLTDGLLQQDDRACGTDQKFFQYLDRLEGQRVLLCTDDPETEAVFHERYGERIVSYTKRSSDRTVETAIVDAFVDLLLLSKTKTILGCHRSTFSEMAWWFGGCQAWFIPVGAEACYDGVTMMSLDE